MKEYTNDLINESSPYLLQHAHNPVNWQAWNDKSLEEAKETNKLIVVSVGYAACHWCHVMERESFEDKEVADIMNANYISIKVDREERPDVDQVYMDAAQLITGRGGWPLNVIALPDGRPIYAGTYFTKAQWIKVLLGVQDFYKKTPEKALEQAMQVSAGVNKMNYVPVQKSSSFKQEVVEQSASDWMNALDIKEGGRAGQMKFPMPGAYLALLRYGVANQNNRALELTRLTLDKMASGGLYDQIGGGFSRYSVDPYWHVPHFEKMLYDNAQLITLYSEAYKYFEDPFYLQIIEETIAFCERELKAKSGGYISSIDADSEGEEGTFYIWTETEVDSILDEDAALFKDFYGITPEGNWEKDKNVLKMSKSLEELSSQFSLSHDEIGIKIKNARNKLFEVRSQRERPTDDDKILTSWNSLMVTGLAHAYEASGDEDYRDLALSCARFIDAELIHENTIKRTFKNGQAKINGFLDDYAFTISAFIKVYEITFDLSWITKAEGLLEMVLKEFKNSKTELFNFKSILDKELFIKKQVLEDNVIPSGNSEMAKNLFIIGSLLDKEEFILTSATMVGRMTERIKEHSAFYYNWFDLYSLKSSKFLEIVIMGDNWDEKRKTTKSMFVPYALVAGGIDESLNLFKNRLIENKTMVYVCVDKICQLPLEIVEKDTLQANYL